MVRRRPTPKRRSRSILRTSIIAALLVIAVAVSLPAASFSTGTLDRDASVDVVSDPDGVLGLEIATSVSKNQQDWLANVTNNFETTVTVTISLPNNDGTLYFGGDSGTTVSASLGPGTMETAEIDVDNNLQSGDVVEFTITATGTGVEANADRTTTVESGNGGGGNNGQGNN